MGRAERRAMARRKPDYRVLVVGFEKRFESLTDARTELSMIWPETEKLLDTPAGKRLLTYTLLGDSDDMLDADMKMLNAAGRGAVLDGQGNETLLAKAFGIKGAACLISWGGAGFGWEPVKDGAFMAFIETWPGKVFSRGGKVDLRCRGLGWRPNLEVSANRGWRRMGNVDDLKQFLAAGADQVAQTLGGARTTKPEDGDASVL